MMMNILLGMDIGDGIGDGVGGNLALGLIFPRKSRSCQDLGLLAALAEE